MMLHENEMQIFIFYGPAGILVFTNLDCITAWLVILGTGKKEFEGSSVKRDLIKIVKIV